MAFFETCQFWHEKESPQKGRFYALAQKG